MKNALIAWLLLAAVMPAQGQFGTLLDKAKKKAEEKVIKKADRKADDAPGENEGRPATEGRVPKEDGGTTSSGGPGIKAYSKFDFVPGQVVLAFDDFMQDEVGNFPDKWNTNSSGEVVTMEGLPGHWFMFSGGIFTPEYIDSMPGDFTLEFDLACDDVKDAATINVALCELQAQGQLQAWRTSPNIYVFSVYPAGAATTSERRKLGVSEPSVSMTSGALADWSAPVHVSVWRQRERVRVYFNEHKAWDVPKALASEAKPNALLFDLPSAGNSFRYYISNLRFAVGAPDTRNKLITEGRWVTTGILFDVNRATIKPESYGTLREIATVLKESADVRVKIIGHTDADGSEAANLDLSKRRAAAVREVLAKDFSIDESRMATDGLGESKPVDTNDTPAGKSNNRRVEFVKM